jgi:hypothetical protein
MNMADSASVQKLASQITGEGEMMSGIVRKSAKGNVVLSYRASKVADLEKLGSEALEEGILDLGEPIVSGKKKDATISKLFGSSNSKSKQPASGSASGSTTSGKLVVKKKSVLEPVTLGATSASASASASVIGKSKVGTKASLSKIGKLNLGSNVGESESSINQ